jgi:uncharacterized protein (TIGR03435 family)
MPALGHSRQSVRARHAPIDLAGLGGVGRLLIQPQPVGLHLRTMAGVTVLLEDRLNVAREVGLCLRLKKKRSQKRQYRVYQGLPHAYYFITMGFTFAMLLMAGSLFDVASVKPQPWTGQDSVGISTHGNTLDAEHVCLNDLVQYAWNLRDLQLSGGPAWAQRGKLDSSDLYQVVAKAPGDATPSAREFREMLQTLLTERFQLKVRHATKDLPVYNLVVAKGGLKMKASAEDEKFAMSVDSRVNGGKVTRVTAKHCSIEQLLGYLEPQADRPLTDRSGLSGFYDFEIEYSHPGGPALTTALQSQLGLKLEAATAPFDMVVIEHAEKPSAN